MDTESTESSHSFAAGGAPQQKKTAAKRNFASKLSRKSSNYESWKTRHVWLERTVSAGEEEASRSVYCGPCHREQSSSPWGDKVNGIKTPKLDGCNKHAAANFHVEVSLPSCSTYLNFLMEGINTCCFERSEAMRCAV